MRGTTPSTSAAPVLESRRRHLLTSVYMPSTDPPGRGRNTSTSRPPVRCPLSPLRRCPATATAATRANDADEGRSSSSASFPPPGGSALGKPTATTVRSSAIQRDYHPTLSSFAVNTGVSTSAATPGGTYTCASPGGREGGALGRRSPAKLNIAAKSHTATTPPLTISSALCKEWGPTTSPPLPTSHALPEPCGLYDLHHLMQHRLVDAFGWVLHWSLDAGAEVTLQETAPPPDGPAHARSASPEANPHREGSEDAGTAQVKPKKDRGALLERDAAAGGGGGAAGAAKGQGKTEEEGKKQNVKEVMYTIPLHELLIDRASSTTSARYSDPSTPMKPSSHDANTHEHPFPARAAKIGVVTHGRDCVLCHDLLSLKASTVGTTTPSNPLRSRLHHSPFEYRLASLQRWLRKRASESLTNALLIACLSPETQRYLAYLGLSDCSTSYYMTAGLPNITIPDAPPEDFSTRLPSTLTAASERLDRVPLSFYALPALCRWTSVAPSRRHRILSQSRMHPFPLAKVLELVPEGGNHEGHDDAPPNALPPLHFFTIQQQSHLPDQSRSSHRRHKMISLGDTCVCDIYLVAASGEHSRTMSRSSAPPTASVWGYIPSTGVRGDRGRSSSRQDQSATPKEPTHRSKAAHAAPTATRSFSGELFYITSSIENYLRLGIMFGWVYGWQACFSSAGPPLNSVVWLRLVNAPAYAMARAASLDDTPSRTSAMRRHQAAVMRRRTCGSALPVPSHPSFLCGGLRVALAARAYHFTSPPEPTNVPQHSLPGRALRGRALSRGHRVRTGVMEEEQWVDTIATKAAAVSAPPPRSSSSRETSNGNLDREAGEAAAEVRRRHAAATSERRSSSPSSHRRSGVTSAALRKVLDARGSPYASTLGKRVVPRHTGRHGVVEDSDALHQTVDQRCAARELRAEEQDSLERDGYDPALVVQIDSRRHQVRLNGVQRSLLWSARQRQYHDVLHRLVACLQSHRTPLEKCQTLYALHDEVIHKRLRLRADTYADIFHVLYSVGVRRGGGAAGRPGKASLSSSAQLVSGSPDWDRDSSGQDATMSNHGGSLPVELATSAAVSSTVLSSHGIQHVWEMYRYLVDSGTDPTARILQYVMGLLEHASVSLAIARVDTGEDSSITRTTGHPRHRPRSSGLLLVEAKAHSLMMDADRFRLTPSEFTLNSYIAICEACDVMHLAVARVTDYQTRHERQASPGMYARLLTGLVRCGHYEDATAVATTMQSVAMTTYLLNAVLQAARHSRDPMSAFSMYRSIFFAPPNPLRMGKANTAPTGDCRKTALHQQPDQPPSRSANGLRPSLVTFSILVEVMLHTCNYFELSFVVAEMRYYGVKGNGLLLNKILRMMAASGHPRTEIEALRNAMDTKRVRVFDENRT